jgi:hypothetical protein
MDAPTHNRIAVPEWMGIAIHLCRGGNQPWKLKPLVST